MKKNKKLNILILNWRDIKNPQSGGAEILTQEISERFVRLGHRVVIFSSFFKGAKKKEKIHGVEIIRDGNPDLRSLFSSVHFKAFIYYKKKAFGDLDVVIDEIHGVPFFTPLFIKEKSVVLICELAGQLWDIAFSFPFNYLGHYFEKIYPIFYKKNKIITISDSTRKDLSKLFPENNINVVYPGCSTPIIKRIKKKPKDLRLIFIARLSNAKGIEDAFSSVEILKKKHPHVRLDILGRGSSKYISSLKIILKRKKIQKNIFFHGFVNEATKVKLIDKSHLIILPSKKEGWGLTVHEANSRGVPAIAYNVEGLRDVVKNGKNGFLCKENTAQNMAELIEKTVSNKRLYAFMSRQSVNERKKFTWDNTANKFLHVIKNNK